MDNLCKDDSKPDWFLDEMKAALLAPTAMNQHKFLFTLNGNKVSAKATGGFCPEIDPGADADKDNFEWR